MAAPLPRLRLDRLSELLEVIIDEYNAIREALRALNPPRPQLQVLSLDEYIRTGGESRWVNLTQMQYTRVDDAFLESFARLCSAYEELGSMALMLASEAPPPVDKVLVTTYLRGKASINFITMNLASSMLTIPPQHALAEISIVVSCAGQLAGLLRSARRVMAGAEARA